MSSEQDTQGRAESSIGRSMRGPRLFALALLALGILALVGAFQIQQGGGYIVVGPRVFPFAVAIGLVALSLIFLLRTTIFPDLDLAERAAAEEAVTHWGTVAMLAILLVLYVFALRPLGYVVATTLFYPAVAWVLGSHGGRTGVVRNVLIGLILSTVIYVTFTRFLGVRLPAGLLDFFW